MECSIKTVQILFTEPKFNLHNLCAQLYIRNHPFSRLLRHTWVKAVMLFYSYITNQKAATNQHSKLNHKVHSSQTTSTDAKPIQHTETTHPYDVNSTLAFPKVASSHPHYLTFTIQTYHHPEDWFRSWLFPRLTIQTENTTSITPLTQIYTPRIKTHYL